MKNAYATPAGHHWHAKWCGQRAKQAWFRFERLSKNTLPLFAPAHIFPAEWSANFSATSVGSVLAQRGFTSPRLPRVIADLGIATTV
jgi:hypothetical protein